MNDRVELNPKDAMALGREMFRINRLDDARASFEAVADTCPDDWDAAFQTAFILSAQQNYDEALPWYDRAMAIALTQANLVCLNRAVALGELGRSEEGAVMLEALIARQPGHAHALYNLGVLYMQMDRFEEALDLFERSIDIDPATADGDAIYCLGFANLVLGDYLEGFKGFENRLKANVKGGPAQGEELRPDHLSRWSGHSKWFPMLGKTVLVLSEMGRGDMIQFGRYLPLLVDYGLNILLVADRGTEALFRDMPGVTVFAPTDVLPSADYWCHMMGLAHVFQTTVDTVPPPMPLVYDEAMLAKWRRTIPDDGILNVGLCWAGNPESRYDNHRTIPLEILDPVTSLACYKKVRFYSLQQTVRDCDKEADEEQPLYHIGHLFTDFRQTAHAMKCLDLVITVDTSVAHMAGTVGVPTWILVTRFRTYWLWLKGREDTPWYLSVRLIRQPIHGSWPSTVEVVRDRLLGMLAAR